MAGVKFINTARKLQTACNRLFGVKLLINQKQWFNTDRKRAVTRYDILQTIQTGDEEHTKNILLFSTYSQIQLVLFLRDYWYELNGWEVPTDNIEWQEIKERYGQNTNKNKTAEKSSGENGV